MFGRLLPKILLFWAVAFFAFLFGYAVCQFKIFPYWQMLKLTQQFEAVSDKLKGVLPEEYVASSERRSVILHKPGQVSPGMTLVSGVGPKGRLFASLVEADGSVEHSWDLDWFRIWPDARHLPADMVPKQRPGAGVHGIVMSPNGDLTFNYDDLGMAQVDVCGRVKWRLPRMTHHAIWRDDDGNFWTLDLILHDKPVANAPNYKPPFSENGILVVSPEGKVIRRFSLYDILRANGFQGLMYLFSSDNLTTAIHGDAQHLNDVEVFSRKMKPGLFQPGDVMVSIRNANTVMVFDPKTLKIKQLVFGRFIRQHDPDFIDGSTITLLDNNDIGTDQAHGSSRIVEYSFKTGQERVIFQGNPTAPFFTESQGKHQWLENGNLLITEAKRARALEIDPHGQMVWEYFNQIGGGLLGHISEAQRISPSEMTPAELKRLASSCPGRAG